MILALSGCTSSQAPSTSGLSDSALEQLIRTKLATEPQLASAISVTANADRNEVTLSGTIPSEELQSKAVELAKASKDPLTIMDKIDVKPPEVSRNEYTESMAREARDKAKVVGDKIGNTIDDAWIHTKITAKLMGNKNTPARKINVNVMNNVVTLRGALCRTVDYDFEHLACPDNSYYR